MGHYFARSLRGCGVVAALALSIPCSGGQSPLYEDQAQALRFSLASEGLPSEGMWKSTPTLADVNGDGHVDLAAMPRIGEGPRVWLGNGVGDWRDASEGLKWSGASSCGGGVAFGDVNNDGHLDLAAADHCDGAFVYLGDGRGGWKLVTEALNPKLGLAAQPVESEEDTETSIGGAEDLALGDINEDGALDLVVAASDQGGLTVYLGNGSGASWEEVSSDGLPSAEDPGESAGDMGGWANQVLLHDMNGDGHLDVVASYFLGPRVWLGNGEARWTQYSEGLPSPIVGGLFRGIAVDDVNEDGRLDLAVANGVNGPEIFLQSKSGVWQRTPDVFPDMKGGAVGVALGDLDQDGHPDLVTGGRLERQGSGYGLMVHRGDGAGGWHELPRSGLPSRGLPFTWGIALGDLNGDGLADIAAATGGSTDGTVSRTEGGQTVLPNMQVWLNDAHRAIAKR